MAQGLGRGHGFGEVGGKVSYPNARLGAMCTVVLAQSNWLECKLEGKLHKGRDLPDFH